MALRGGDYGTDARSNGSYSWKKVCGPAC